MTIEIGPRRLAARDDAVGDAVRAALDESPTRDAGPVPFDALLTEHRRRTAQRRTRLVALAAAGTLAFWYIGRPGGVLFERGALQASSISAEDPTQFQLPGRAPREAPRSPPAATQDARALPALETTGSSPTKSGKSVAEPERAREDKHPVRRPEASTAANGAAGLAACQSSLRDGAYESAVGCYETQARGTGVSAELAWLEKARVERRALHAPERALATLSAYAQRFTTGALRPEATLTRLELLDELGRVPEALVLVDAVLAERLAPTREAELRALQARLLARANRCDEARSALSDALRLGASTHYAAAVHERCGE